MAVSAHLLRWTGDEAIEKRGLDVETGVGLIAIDGAATAVLGILPEEDAEGQLDGRQYDGVVPVGHRATVVVVARDPRAGALDIRAGGGREDVPGRVVALPRVHAREDGYNAVRGAT